MKKNITKILFGVTALGVGIFLLGGALEFWNIRGFDGWWTLFLIVPAIGSMISSGIRFGNALLFGAGVWLFVYEQNILNDRQIKIIGLSIIFFALGLWLIISSIKKQKNSKSPPVNENGFPKNGYNQKNDFKNPCYDTSSSPEYLAILSGGEYVNNCNDFCGGSATAIFGGLDIDLSGIQLNRNVVFHSTAIFGGVDLYVPSYVRVEVNGTAILGGCDNYAPKNTNTNIPTLTIKYFSIFGGIDVKVK